MGKLEGNVAIVTGGARGIGKQIALSFATEGANIVIGDMLEMEVVAEEIKNLGREVVILKTDISKKEEVKKLIDVTMNRFDKVDILVNNAGKTFGCFNVLSENGIPERISSSTSSSAFFKGLLFDCRAKIFVDSTMETPARISVAN